MTANRTTSLRKLGDVLRESNAGALLDDIRDEPVTIALVRFRTEQGFQGTYRKVRVELADGRQFETGAGAVVAKLGSVPPDAFPIEATFTQKPSPKDPDMLYWDVE